MPIPAFFNHPYSLLLRGTSYKEAVAAPHRSNGRLYALDPKPIMRSARGTDETG
jgi:hypothetical protein